MCQVFHLYHETVQLLCLEKAVFKDAVYRPETVLPTYFFAFGIGASVVGDANFVDPYIRYPGYFGGYFWLKAKSAFFEVDGLDHFGIK